MSAIGNLRSSGKLTGPVTVYLRAGTYYQPSALTLGHADSGTRDFPITFTSYPGEIAVISGGVRIDKWKWAALNGKHVWEGAAPGDSLSSS
jgi:hypothetical protein